MKQFSKFFLALAATTMLFSCSSDEPNPAPTPDADGEAFYASVKFTMPKSRSVSSVGTEVGKDEENSVKSLLVILASKDGDTYKYVSYAYAPTGNTALTQSGSNFKLVFNDRQNLLDQAGKAIFLFAYCNPTAALADAAKGLKKDDDLTEFFNKTFKHDATYQAESTWQDNNFLMTSDGIYSTTLPSKDVLKSSNKPESAYDLTQSGPVSVIRTAVRFDFRDAATYKKYGAPVAFTYAIPDINNNTKVQGLVTITRMALFNMRDEFYFLPRTTTDGTAITLCPGADATKNFDFPNYMVTPDAHSYLFNLPLQTADISTFDPTTATYGLEWKSASDIIAGNEDNDNGWTVDPKDGYHIWRYGTENNYAYSTTTFAPADATGVVFEVEMKNADGNAIGDGTNPVFVYGGTIYKSAVELCQAAENAKGSQLNVDVTATFDYTVVDNNVTDAALKSTYATSRLANNISIYAPKGGKYYCYYYYFNRHNDNNDPSVTQKYEFATIRNNIYKLAVTNIKMWATNVPPSKVEDYEIYFSLQVLVRPWTVRVNNIEF